MSNSLVEAAEIIKKGGIVIFPTETVYGLGANAFDAKAVKKIFKAKGRPADNPLIVHIADKKDLKDIVREVPTIARKLVNEFWPGPLTLILKKSAKIPKEVTAGLDTVAVRLPNHALARALIREAGVPIAAPSANISGKPSPTEASHAKKDLAKKVDYVLSAGKSKFGLESTVVNILSRPPVILRQGAVAKEEIEKIVGSVKLWESNSYSFTVKSPGMKYRHYAPEAKLILQTPESIEKLVEGYKSKKKRVGVLGTRENYQFYKKADRVIILGSKKNLNTCAANLFRALRDFDRFNDIDVILAETFPEVGIGAAIMERLKKAAVL